MFKKICNAVLKNIWLQLLALILALCGLTLLIGASFENVSTTSKGFSPSSPDPDASSSEESHGSSKDDFDDFLNGSGAFGDWENFSSFYVETEPVPSKPSSTPSSSTPESSAPAASSEPSSESSVEPPIPEESSAPEESSDPDAPSPDAPSESSSAPGSDSSPEEPIPSEPSSSEGGDSPMDAPSISTEDGE